MSGDAQATRPPLPPPPAPPRDPRPPRRPYRPPVLTPHGQLVDLVAGSAPGIGESGNTPFNPFG